MTLSICLNLGNEIFITNHTEAITIGGKTYTPNAGLSFSSLSEKSDPSRNEVIFSILADDSQFNTDKFQKGYFLFQKVFLTLYNPHTQKLALIKSGYIKTSEVSKNQATFTLSGLANSLSTNICKMYSSKCRTKFGSSECTIDIESRKIQCTIGKIISNTQLKLDGIPESISNSPQGSYAFQNGSIKFEQFKNFSFFDISSINQSTVFLYNSLPFSIKENDELSLYPGCDKTNQTCKTQYQNIINFRGEPFILNKTDS